MRKALIVGGANGIGLSIATQLSNREDCERVYIVDKVLIAEQYLNQKFESIQFDLITEDYSIFDSFKDVDTLMITAGFGKPSLFKDIAEQHITSSFSVNAVAPIRIIHHFMDKLVGKEDFRCGVMVSIAGFMSSPFFAVYGATKAALKIFIESLNVKLEKGGSTNRILNVSLGSIKGTSFNNGKTDLSVTEALANEIIEHLEAKDDLFIPQYEEIFKQVLARYKADFREEGRHSYEYKLNRMKSERLPLPHPNCISEIEFFYFYHIVLQLKSESFAERRAA